MADLEVSARVVLADLEQHLLAALPAPAVGVEDLAAHFAAPFNSALRVAAALRRCATVFGDRSVDLSTR